jgi:hypothetical protein
MQMDKTVMMKSCPAKKVFSRGFRLCNSKQPQHMGRTGDRYIKEKIRKK